MLRNYTSTATLQAYVPHLTNLQWTSQSDYSEQIDLASYEVRDDLFNRGLKSVYLRPDLTLEEGTSSLTTSTTNSAVEDELSRNRWVINCTAISGGDKTVTLEGSNDDSTYATVATATVTATGETTELLTKNYLYYRLSVAVSSGAITLQSYLTETNYDKLFNYKTLIIILRPLIKSEGDQFHLAYMEFQKLYSDLLNNMKIHYDTNLDEALDDDETVSNKLVRYLK